MATALADILLSIDFNRGLRKIICYTGLYKPNNGRYNHEMTREVQSLVISFYQKHQVKAKETRKMLKT